MRLVSYLADGGHAAAGIRLKEDVIPLAGLGHPDGPPHLLGLLALGAEELAAIAERLRDAPRLPLAKLRLLPPIPRPGKIICVGLNYRLHAEEGNNPVPDYPAIFLRAATSLVAPGEAMIRPKISDQLDYEGELAVIIGRPARYVPEARALEHVGGYACFNDGSVRDYQRKTSQWGAGKNFDRTAAFGPEIVTPDELPAGGDGLRLITRLNGEIVQNGNTADMIFKVARLIALLSEIMTLEAGDVIATGTPAGVGYARNPPRFLAPGDMVEVEIEGIGVLRNPVAAEA